MWQKNDGFFLVELMLSLSGWLVIAGVIFPLIMHAVNQSIQLQQEFVGTQLLYEYLQSAKAEGKEPVNETVNMEHSIYEIFWKTEGEPTITEVCIKYEDIFGQTHKKCEIFQ